MKKQAGIFFFILLLISFSFSSFSSDTKKRISTINIRVDEFLKNLDTSELEDLPDISSADFSVSDSANYEIDAAFWDSDTILRVGKSPRIILYLNALSKDKSNGDEINYYFGGGYNASNVTVSGGTFVKIIQDSIYSVRVVIDLKPVKGKFDPPENISWISPFATLYYTMPSQTSGYVRITLYRDQKEICTILTDQTAVSLYPYMTQKGMYYCELQTVKYPNSAIGSNSEKIMTSILEVTEDLVSDGNGKYVNDTWILGSAQVDTDTSGSYTSNSSLTSYNSGTEFTVYNASTGETENLNRSNGNWEKNAYWYYRKADGTILKQSWLYWNGSYYRFDSEGRMLTGIYQDQKGTYYLSPDGHMKTGWVNLNSCWYYFNPSMDEGYGLMYKDSIINIGDRTYYLDKDGIMRTGWIVLSLEGYNGYYYFYPESSVGSDFGYLAKNTVVSGGQKVGSDGRLMN